MRAIRIPLVLSILVAGLAVLPPPSRAELILREAGPRERPTQLDIVGAAGFFGYTHLGAGVWYGLPIVPEGFIRNLNEAFFLEFGGFLERYSWDWGYCDYSWYRATPMGGARWNFYLTPAWTVFATAKAGYAVGFGTSWDCGGWHGSDEPDWSELALDFGVGAYWNVSDSFKLRLEAGDFGFVLGAGFSL